MTQPTPQTPTTRHAELETLLTQAQAAYHDGSAPILTDDAYDALLAEQRTLEAQDAALPRAATAQIGTPTPGSEKHATPMQSLDNAFDHTGLTDFGLRLRRKLGLAGDHTGFTVEAKIDGLSANLEYVDGVLSRATTRGDGESGEDVTGQLRRMGVPEHIRARGIIEIRGEVYMPLSAFEAHNAQAADRGEAGFKNARNAAVGSLKKGTPARVANLRLAVYGVGSLGDLDTRSVGTQSGFLDWAAAQGFAMAPGTVEVHSLEDAWAAHQHLEAGRAALDFDADGSVIKVNHFDVQREAGRNSRAPAWALALKFVNRATSTVLEDVVFTTGRTGRVTPTAALRPVDLDGSTIARATLHNSDYVTGLDLHYGDTVTLEKAGGVIPKVSGVIPELRPAGAARVVMPTHCPACAGALVRVVGEADTFCVNAACPSQSESQLRHVVASDVLDIQHLGEVLVAGLHASGISEYTQLYGLTVADLAALRLPGEDGQGTRVLGPKTAAKVAQEIRRSKTAELWRHIRALGIGLTGRGTSKRLARQFSSLEELAVVASSVGGFERLGAIDDIGPDTAAAIVFHFTQGPGLDQVHRLAEAGVAPSVSEDAPSGTALAGLKVVVTGTFPAARSEIETWLAAQGASVSSSVTGKTSLLLAGDKAGSKLDRAEKLGVKVVDQSGITAWCLQHGLTWLG